ncbi:hypothetical protein BDY21DRAFT_119754 [Lineolata rhizophorae]|uniref:C2H2-type domain-containing protein n=1 Tax=Lineolata rhizophorae TaxID=578093 RepID=A0A6A6NQ50_9PEZI|nr:hypothetical protein BDY21DRAFT_119754 [Lineolata rhizophorae]
MSLGQQLHPRKVDSITQVSWRCLSFSQIAFLTKKEHFANATLGDTAPGSPRDFSSALRSFTTHERRALLGERRDSQSATNEQETPGRSFVSQEQHGDSQNLDNSPENPRDGDVFGGKPRPSHSDSLHNCREDSYGSPDRLSCDNIRPDQEQCSVQVARESRWSRIGLKALRNRLRSRHRNSERRRRGSVAMSHGSYDIRIPQTCSASAQSEEHSTNLDEVETTEAPRLPLLRVSEKPFMESSAALSNPAKNAPSVEPVRASDRDQRANLQNERPPSLQQEPPEPIATPRPLTPPKTPRRDSIPRRSTTREPSVRYQESHGRRSVSSMASRKSSARPRLDCHVIQSRIPRPFQCTLCLTQCRGAQEWTEHEATHIQQNGWTCMLGEILVDFGNGEALCAFCGAVDSRHEVWHHGLNECGHLRIEDRTFPTKEDLKKHLSHFHNHHDDLTKEMESWEWPKVMDTWYWKCGFCNLVLQSWSERREHIAGHFAKGKRMTDWSPTTSPYPLRRRTMTPVEGFPGWNGGMLLDIQEPQLSDYINGVGRDGKGVECKICKIGFNDKNERGKHIELWHQRPRSWTCPDLHDLSIFFGPLDSASDVCLSCDEIFKSNPPTQDVRIAHLAEAHGFGGCGHGKKFLSSGDFALHLASRHRVGIDHMKEWIDLCGDEELPPVRIERPPRTGVLVWLQDNDEDEGTTSDSEKDEPRSRS